MRQASADRGPHVAAPRTSRANGQARQAHICMHVLKTARTDVRVWREATALRAAGMAVTIVDLDSEGTRPREETIDDIRVKHVRVRFTPSRFKPLFLIKYARVLLLGALKVLSTPADAYHAHDVDAFPACYMAARARRRALVLDAHELPLAQPNYIRWRRLHGIASQLLRAMM